MKHTVSENLCILSKYLANMLQLNAQGKTSNEGKNINVHKMYDNLSADIGSHVL